MRFLAAASLFAFLFLPHFNAVTDLSGKHFDSLDPANLTVLLFVRSDCPITNRYAPELAAIAQRYEPRGVRFYLVYPDRSETEDSIKQHIAAYHLPGTPLRDPQAELVSWTHATTAPEAVVVDNSHTIRYRGRIDDRYISLGRSRPGGPLTHDLADSLDSLLAGKPVRQATTVAFGCSLADLR